jgi:hypothetical protein
MHPVSWPSERPSRERRAGTQGPIRGVSVSAPRFGALDPGSARASARLSGERGTMECNGSCLPSAAAGLVPLAFATDLQAVDRRRGVEVCDPGYRSAHPGTERRRGARACKNNGSASGQADPGAAGLATTTNLQAAPRRRAKGTNPSVVMPAEAGIQSSLDERVEHRRCPLLALRDDWIVRLRGR